MVEWDKDDLDALGILKIDVLALGMLTCIRKAFELLERHYGKKLDLATIPAEDPAVYEMLGRADSIGVFQVESRAQMTMLPRLKPQSFYDLVIEVAIVRPGPIQGDMVHPYLRRRSGEERVEYPSEALKGVLEKTLGVPLFQEQAMQIAIVGAGFTPSESDRLRRAMATFKRVGTIHTFRAKFIAGMVKNGYARAFAERCFQQIEGFGTYGFPEMPRCELRAPGLRLGLAEVPPSRGLRLRALEQPADGLLRARPDRARRPGPRRRRAAGRRQRERVGLHFGGRDAGPRAGGATGRGRNLRSSPRLVVSGLRLGFRQVKGLKAGEMAPLALRRGAGYVDLPDLRRRSGVSAAALDRLARADAFTSLALSRRGALWQALGLERTGHERDLPPLSRPRSPPTMTEGRHLDRST